MHDFIVLVDNGHGADDLLHLVVEIKGYRSVDDFKAKVETEFNKMIGGTLEREGVMP